MTFPEKEENRTHHSRKFSTFQLINPAFKQLGQFIVEGIMLEY